MAAMKDQLFKIINDHKEELSERFHVESLAVFGSVARGTADQNSDVDVLVRYKETPGLFEFLNLKKYLEGIVGRRVDLVTEGALKKQLRKQIMRESIRVA